MPANTAAWLPAKRAPLEVKPSPYAPPTENEIIVKNHAVAINPLDWIIQSVGYLIFPYIKYPAVLGADLSGEVVEVGASVTRFKVGDRVLGHAIGVDSKRDNPAFGAFQTYTTLPQHMAAPIPGTMPYENAAVIPLTTSTAACGLFQKDHLALAYPTVPPKPTGQAVLIWGGSTSVGSNAIQLAVSAGYEVFTTASPRNFDYVKSLGASQAFDYNNPTAVKDLIRALKGKTLAGALAVGAGSAEACLDIVHASSGRKFVSMASFPLSFANLASGPFVRLRFLAKVPKLLWFNLTFGLKSRMRHISTKFIFGSTLMTNEVSQILYTDFLPKALETGQFVPAPPPQVIGNSLAYIQPGLDAQRQGVSARKLVITL